MYPFIFISPPTAKSLGFINSKFLSTFLYLFLFKNGPSIIPEFFYAGSKIEFIKYSDEAQRNAAKRIAWAIGRNGTPGILYYSTAIQEILDERSPAFFQYLNEAIAFELDIDGRNKKNQ